MNHTRERSSKSKAKRRGGRGLKGRKIQKKCVGEYYEGGENATEEKKKKS